MFSSFGWFCVGANFLVGALTGSFLNLGIGALLAVLMTVTAS